MYSRTHINRRWLGSRGPNTNCNPGRRDTPHDVTSKGDDDCAKEVRA